MEFVSPLEMVVLPSKKPLAGVDRQLHGHTQLS